MPTLRVNSGTVDSPQSDHLIFKSNAFSVILAEPFAFVLRGGVCLLNQTKFPAATLQFYFEALYLRIEAKGLSP
jgi:hypothetical protein